MTPLNKFIIMALVLVYGLLSYTIGVGHGERNASPPIVYCNNEPLSQMEVGCYTFQYLGNQLSGYRYLALEANVIIKESLPYIHEGGRLPLLERGLPDLLDSIKRWRNALSVVSSTHRPNWRPSSPVPGDTFGVHPTGGETGLSSTVGITVSIEEESIGSSNQQ